MGYRIDEDELARALDMRVLPTLPTEWPGGDAWPARSFSVGEHLDYLHSLNAAGMERNLALTLLVDSVNDALGQYSDGVGEDAREPYSGCASIDGDVLRIRFGRVPRSSPDDGVLAPELESIPLGDIIVEGDA